MAAVPKFLNTPQSAAADEIDGLLLMRPDLCRVPGAPNVVARKVIEKGKVALICGGGSGHEPAHAAFVAEGWLSAAVCGEVFASPSHAAVIKAIRHVSAANDNAGVLVIIKNYAGDVINFSYAATAVCNEGIVVDTFVFGDDVAFGAEHDEQRGIAGTVLLYKILGSMAESGASLHALHSAAKSLRLAIRSIGISMSSCAVPGMPFTATLPPNVFELGMGIHGEPGKEQLPLEPLDGIVKRMVSLLLSPPAPPETATSIGHRSNKSSPSYILAVNNLGGTTDLEMCCVVKAAVEHLQTLSSGSTVAAIVFGRFMTALEMHGFSLTLIQISETWIPEKLLIEHLENHLSAVPAFRITSPVPLASEIATLRSAATATGCESLEAVSLKDVKWGMAGDAQSFKMFIDVASRTATELAKLESDLNKLDAAVGDGDIGSGLARSCAAILKLIGSHDSTSSPLPISVILHQIALVVADSWGGTAGPLFGAFFAAAAAACEGYEGRMAEQPHASVVALAAAVQAGVAAVMSVGKAQLGDRTMIDALQPAAQALLAESTTEEKSSNFAESLNRAITAAVGGASTAMQLPAKRGRARYSNRREIGKEDPGCELVVAALRAIAAALTTSKTE